MHWDTACSTYAAKKRPSSLAIVLRNTAWILTKDGSLRKPDETTAADLAKGYVIGGNEEWLRAIGFGEHARQRSEQHRARRQAGELTGPKGYSQRRVCSLVGRNCRRYKLVPPSLLPFLVAVPDETGRRGRALTFARALPTPSPRPISESCSDHGFASQFGEDDAMGDEIDGTSTVGIRSQGMCWTAAEPSSAKMS